MPKTLNPQEELDRLAAENLQLREVINRSTIELDHKNRELEIESALEQVRAIAMSMQEPNGMLDICKMISDQLNLLGVKEIRNVQTAIIYAAKGTYLNFEYYTKHDRSFVTEVHYDNHQMSIDFVQQMLKDPDGFFTHGLNGDELSSWYAFQKTTNQFVDDFLATTDSLNYYWHSAGPVALGISTYLPLLPQEIDLFKRFRNVFGLAYRRYLDIENALAQAREVRIELALERVRTRTMAMQRSEEMVDASHVLFNELHALGIETIRTGIGTFDEEKETVTVWSSQYVNQNDSKILGVVPKQAHPFFEGYYNAWKRKESYFTYSMSGDEVRSYYTTMSSILSYPLQNEFNSKETFQTFFFPEGSLNVITHEPLSEESCQLLIRFARVFGLIYRRFLDLKQAENQAKEANIEASLERVRTTAMIMRKPEELSTVGEVIFTELKSLGFADLRNTEIIINLDKKESVVSYYYSDYGITGVIELSYLENPILKKWALEMKSAVDAFSKVEILENEIVAWRIYREQIGYQPDPKLDTATSIYYYSYSTGLGALSISSFAPISDEQMFALQRFKNVFGLAYRRYVDVTQAEVQAREAKIELALERVRARTMAMQRSDELSETAQLLFQQLKDLGETPIQITIGIFNEEEGIIDFNVTDWGGAGNQIDRTFKASIEEPTLMQKIYTAWKANQKSVVVDLTGQELLDWVGYRNAMSGTTDHQFKLHDRRTVHVGLFSKGLLSFSTHEPRPAESVNVLERFASVFDQTYTRFLDLKQAEAQTKESQIQLALERVRARTMAMQRSDELKNAAALLFQQIKALGVPAYSCGYNIWEKGENEFTSWMSTQDGSIINGVPNIPLTEDANFIRYVKSKQSGEEFFVLELRGERMQEHYEYLKTIPAFKAFFEYAISVGFDLPETQIHHLANFSNGNLLFITLEPCPEFHEVFKRFAAVFEQTYTRFLDLQKAEAQTREAQIEAALEKVRSRSLAVHQSEEFKEVINIVFEKLEDLGLKVDTASINIFIEGSKDTDVYACGHNENGLDIRKARLRYFDHPIANDLYNVHKNGLDFFVGSYGKEEKNSYYEYQFEHGELKELPDEIKERILQTEDYSLSMAPAKHAIIILNNIDGILLSETEIDIVKRFARVFDQAYTRFLDLQKAEAQAREAQIEAALERVRSKAMAMHSSDDLSETVKVYFHELKSLGMILLRCGVAEYGDEPYLANITVTSATTLGDSFQILGRVKQIGHPVLEGIYEHWARQEEFFPVLQGKDLHAYNQVVSSKIDLPDLPEDSTEYGYYFYFKEGSFFVWAQEKLSDDALKLFRRFTSVLSLTYRRYLDLLDAEKQAKEAKIETGLERVRSRTMAMQNSDELAETAAVLFRQLISLGIAPTRLYIGIVQDANNDIEMWATDEDGSTVNTQFTGKIDRSPVIHEMYDGWKAKLKSKTINLEGQELSDYFQYLSEELHVPFRLGLDQKRRAQTIAYFSKGFIGIASPDPQPEETTTLLERFAGVFNLTFTRFNDLKIAEHHAEQAREDLIQLQIEKKRAEEALTELRATQAQLIQSEKMASLGELTAGIAHEIQNPLNFVNNFSEVNTELIDELKDELATGNWQLAIEIAGNIKENEQKIVHHGKRADAIVKGMLQHSRSSSGAKEPTDINALADEYLRLSYHGLRAKDKTFNATMKTDFDPNIGLVNVIPQDIGRVILNLITNAFHAVASTPPLPPTGGKKFEPTVTVSTKRHLPPIGGKGGEEVEIRVKDNGPGIPQNILDKIFQPFFTTKPTGQGTGLGLSLSYDIIKAHGGELKVETKVGEGTAFIILLPIT